MDRKRTGELLKDARRQAGMTQQEVAEAVGVTRAAVRNWESGEGMGVENFARLLDLYRGKGVALCANELLGLESGGLTPGKYVFDESLAGRILDLPDDRDESVAGNVLNWSPDLIQLVARIPDGARVIDRDEAERIQGEVQAKLAKVAPKTVIAWRRLWKRSQT